jgi:hypothetical protein
MMKLIDKTNVTTQPVGLFMDVWPQMGPNIPKNKLSEQLQTN